MYDDSEQCINSRIKDEIPFVAKTNVKTGKSRLVLYFCAWHVVPSVSPVLSFTYDCTTVIYFARLILNEWTIEQMAFWYLNFKSTWHDVEGTIASPFEGKSSKWFLGGSLRSLARISLCRDDFHHLRWVNDIYNKYVPFNYDSVEALSISIHSQHGVFYLKSCSLFAHIVLTLTDKTRAELLSEIRGHLFATFCWWCLTKLVSFPWNTKFFEVYQRTEITCVLNVEL